MLGILPQYVRDDEDKDIYIRLPLSELYCLRQKQCYWILSPPPLGSQEPLSESP